jgi:hypothetical protein
MGDPSDKIEKDRIKAVQSDFDYREAKGEAMAAEREKEAAKMADSLRSDLEYLIQKHGIANVSNTIEWLSKPKDDFIMLAESANIGSASVMMVTGEMANTIERLEYIANCKKDAKTFATGLVMQKLNIPIRTAVKNGSFSLTEILDNTGQILPAVCFWSENKKTGKRATAKVGYYKS